MKVDEMDIGRAEDHLELAWIELEYAGADIAQLSESAIELSELADLKTLLVRLAVANLALQIAISALAGWPRIPELKIVN
jgi:hypothetical protein